MIVRREYDLLSAGLPPKPGSREVYRIESSQRGRHRLSSTMKHGVRKFDQFQGIEHAIYSFAAKRRNVRR